MDCVFCKIVAKEIPANIIYQDNNVIAFPDINPLAPTHLLIIPRKHIPSLPHLAEADSSLIRDMVHIANQLAKRQGISASGYRLVINSGKQGGQGVSHLHMHLLGGRQLSSALG
ncbi:MAG: histidine triad nucleotide-binding protein [Chloroflexi bacterium]|nr:histidine triad nucleotide-binding protein [Chloroflexota bacterium]